MSLVPKIGDTMKFWGEVSVSPLEFDPEIVKAIAHPLIGRLNAEFSIPTYEALQRKYPFRDKEISSSFIDVLSRKVIDEFPYRDYGSGYFARSIEEALDTKKSNCFTLECILAALLLKVAPDRYSCRLTTFSMTATDSEYYHLHGVLLILDKKSKDIYSVHHRASKLGDEEQPIWQRDPILGCGEFVFYQSIYVTDRVYEGIKVYPITVEEMNTYNLVRHLIRIGEVEEAKKIIKDMLEVLSKSHPIYSSFLYYLTRI